jgi:hypothetical protein
MKIMTAVVGTSMSVSTHAPIVDSTAAHAFQAVLADVARSSSSKTSVPKDTKGRSASPQMAPQSPSSQVFLAAYDSRGGKGGNGDDDVPPSIEGLAKETGQTEESIKKWLEEAQKRVADKLGIGDDDDNTEFSALMNTPLPGAPISPFALAKVGMTVWHGVERAASATNNFVTSEGEKIGLPVGVAAAVGTTVAVGVEVAGGAEAALAFVGL